MWRVTLWENRNRSVLVQGQGHALRAMAAYIDLNPVRARLCPDLKAYPWCGDAGAVAGETDAAEAIRWLVGMEKSSQECRSGYVSSPA